MPEDPKNIFRRARQQQDARAAAEKERLERLAAQKRVDRQRERRARQPEEGAPESEAAQWVRDNFEWEDYPSLWVSKFASWSDYSGSYVDRANGKALLRDHADLFEEGHGGHGTVWVGIPEDKRLAMTDEQWEAIKDAIEGLEDYPIIDDQLHSEMEMEAKDAYWEEYGREGVREFLTKKFNAVDDVDASIAVVARRNEFWDTMFREHDWSDYLVEQEGADFYFDAKGALRNITRDDIVDDGMVEATKKQVFFKSLDGGAESFANQLSSALKQAGVDVENGHHLWQMVKYAEHVLGSVWEVSDRYRSSKAEVDPEDHISLISAEDVVNVLSAPDAHQKMLHKHWAEDPRQLKLPGYESMARALAAALLDAESPRQAMQQMPRFKFKSSQFMGDQVFIQSEEGQGWALPLGCIVADPVGDPDADSQFCIVTGVPTKRGWKWWEPVSPEVFALRFPSRDAAAAHLWLLWKCSGQVREAEDPKQVFRSVAAEAPHYVIAGLSRRGFNVYYSQSGWSDELRKAQRYSKVDALAFMTGWLRSAYPNVTHRSVMRVGAKPTPGSPTIVNMEAEDPRAALRQAKTANPWGSQWKKKEDGSWEARPITNRVYRIVNTPDGYMFSEYRRGALTGIWKLVSRLFFETPLGVKDHFPLRLREAEDPRAVLRMAQDPKGIPKRYIGNMPKEVEIWGRRWFSRTYGNTYFTARIYVDGQQVHFMPEEYGYGDHYRDQSFEWLEDNGYIPKRDRYSNNMPKYSPWEWCDKHGIKFTYHADDVKRRDMFREAQQLANSVLKLEPI